MNQKEFYALKDTHKHIKDDNILPLFMVEDELKKENRLQYHSYQLFVQNFINPTTQHTRLLMKHSTGSGKTIGAIGIAMRFIQQYRENDIGSVYIVAFEGAKKSFYNDLLKYPQFGFVTHRELRQWAGLKKQARSGQASDVAAAKDYGNNIKRRITNRTNNGFFKFVGYKALFNQIFTQDVSNLSEDEILRQLADGTIQTTDLKVYKNSLIICDEIHNVYNSLQKNNWGVALQVILNSDPSIRGVFMSATPINNNPTEIVDLLNLLLPERVRKSDLFTSDGVLKSTKKLRDLSRGVVSYLVDKNPIYYPSRAFKGDAVPGIEYLKFINCPMNSRQQEAYDQVYNQDTNTISHSNIHVVDYILPSPAGNVYKSDDLKHIALASTEWKTTNGVYLTNKVPTGSILQLPQLKDVSSKYFSMMTTIIDIVKNRQGKIMIYHNFVMASGVLFIKEILLKNGIIEKNTAPGPNTICTRCGEICDNHTGADHVFNAARCFLVHGDVDKVTLNSNIETFNQSSNCMGDELLILIGSPKIKESYDLKAIRHVMVMSRPDNISTLIQIIGRSVRKHSHSVLDLELRNVSIYLFIASQHEINKYREKVKEYKTIQTIEKILHENAIDADINHDIIKTGFDDNLGDLEFEISPKQRSLNLSTFNAYYLQEEIDIITYIIKRAFVETSRVWKWNDLLTFIKNPNFDVEYNTSLINTQNAIVAFSRLLWDSDTQTIGTSKNNTMSILDSIFDPMYKYFILPNQTHAMIKQVGCFYILSPIIRNSVILHTDSPYRNHIPFSPTYIDVMKYTNNMSRGPQYLLKSDTFANKYKNVPIEMLHDAICEYGVTFQTHFIEDCIDYIFNSWTDWSTDKHKNHDFYFKILYYYDVNGFIIFANIARSHIYNLYLDYLIDGELDDDRESRHILNNINRRIQRSVCEWSPQQTKQLFTNTLDNSLDRFSKVQLVSNVINKVKSSILPIGHFLSDVPRFYHPNKGWFSSPDYTTAKETWVENPIIIGYTEKSKTGVHIHFKLRKPIQKIVMHKDARLIEKGSRCVVRLKSDLVKVCKQLKITIDPNTSVSVICNKIRIKLLQLEMTERSNGTNIKYFYLHFEKNNQI